MIISRYDQDHLNNERELVSFPLARKDWLPCEKLGNNAPEALCRALYNCLWLWHRTDCLLSLTQCSACSFHIKMFPYFHGLNIQIFLFHKVHCN